MTPNEFSEYSEQKIVGSSRRCSVGGAVIVCQALIKVTSHLFAHATFGKTH